MSSEPSSNLGSRPMELICTTCRALLDAGDGIDTRECFLCGAVVCRENARKAQIRIGEQPWRVEVACLEPFACLRRHADRIMK